MDLADYQDRGVLLVFFSVNCKYCHQDVVLWQRIAGQSDSTHPLVLAIASGDDAMAVAQYARQYELFFPVLLDLDKKDGSLGIAVVPTRYGGTKIGIKG